MYLHTQFLVFILKLQVTYITTCLSTEYNSFEGHLKHVLVRWNEQSAANLSLHCVRCWCCVTKAAVDIWCRLLSAVLYCVDCADVNTNPAAVDTLLPCLLGWGLGVVESSCREANYCAH